MLSYEYVQAEARKAGRRARAEKVRPASIREFSPDHAREFCGKIPFLGDYVPQGWTRAQDISDLFVDSSGLGSDNEAALSVRQFAERLRQFRLSGDNYGFGIAEAGQFQVYIRVYKPDPRDFTHSGNLTDADLALVRKG